LIGTHPTPSSNLIAVACESYKPPEKQVQAQALAEQLHLPYTEITTTSFSFLLVITETRLELRQPQAKTKPLYVDFLSPAVTYRLHRGGGVNQLLARAVGIKSNHRPPILDATAGLGLDSFVLANLGCKVECIERSAIVARLLQDGITRLKQVETFKELPLHLHITDAITFLEAQSAASAAEVIYLDPMFPQRNKSALAKKSMCMLQRLVGSDEDAGLLLQLALKHAKKRVVVKRPRLALPLDQQKPTLVFNGQSTRFDVYIV
jgi:16S rRNA (guanine1516-N2)-methyltransferase